ncbi:MAG: chemotaxis response regulator protein-glutamate methylesterase [Betaproteobacteria bacterium]|nr:chemotaxis response regulator protein-glutamate methylesterase [Betaproteobacteria bacterium]
MSPGSARATIDVLVVEDSPVMRDFLVHILTSDPRIRVVGTAANGEEAIQAVSRRKPDVITMDVHMPQMNGLDATRRIMETSPTPIVVVSGSSGREELSGTFRALEAGALAVVEKPPGAGHPRHEEMARELIQTVKLMSEVHVVRRWPKRTPTVSPAPAARPIPLEAHPTEVKLVAIGASTGGPVVLQTILSRLPKNLPVPIVIVQHIAAGFTPGMAEWLAESSGFPVHVAAQGEYLLPGHAYIAPDGFQMKIEAGNRIALRTDDPENGHRPSVSYLFRSVAEVMGRGAIGVLLSGMGKDGAEELKQMKARGAVTIAQDRETCAVPGMPGEAIELGAADYVLPPSGIAEAIGSLLTRPK